MPNWTRNEITCNKPNWLKQFFDEYENFDFNKLFPMPESLNITDGSETKKAIAVYEFETNCDSTKLKEIMEYLNKDNKTPQEFIESLKCDYLTNKLYFFTRINAADYNPKDFLKSHDEKVKQEYEKYPTLNDLGKAYCENMKNYGAYTWYDWACKNWGTKWNACETQHNDDYTKVYFDTAWALPEPIFNQLCENAYKENIELNFYCEYEEGFVVEGTSFRGDFIVTNQYDLDYEEEYDEEELV